jgi:hypothetical protein
VLRIIPYEIRDKLPQKISRELSRKRHPSNKRNKTTNAIPRDTIGEKQETKRSRLAQLNRSPLPPPNETNNLETPSTLENAVHNVGANSSTSTENS